MGIRAGQATVKLSAIVAACGVRMATAGASVEIRTVCASREALGGTRRPYQRIFPGPGGFRQGPSSRSCEQNVDDVPAAA
jgi:hypothetical protein